MEKTERELDICRDDVLGDYIKSEFNCELDSYRSPWSNKYFPICENPHYPPSELRQLEIHFNKIFKEYSILYYGEKSVSSVFVWEQGENIDMGFSCALLVKNKPEAGKSSWDTSSLVTVRFIKEKEKDEDRLKAVYSVLSTAIYKIQISPIELSGILTRQSEDSHYIKTHFDYEAHIEKIGKLVEFTENNLRNSVDEVYMKKSHEVIFNLRQIIFIIIDHFQNQNRTRTSDFLLFKSYIEPWSLSC